jgi:predicted RND superfamily exporter protein
VADWLPKDYPETTELGWFRQHFIADQFVLISWEHCDLGEDPSGKDDDPRIEKLAAALKEARLEREDGSGSDPVFKAEGITTGRTVLKELMREPTSLGRREATERLEGSLIGPDGKQTVVMANLTETAAKRLRKAIGRPQKRFGLIRQPHSPLFDALEKAGIHEDEVRLGGPPIDNNAIDEEGERSLVRLAGLAFLLGLTLSYYSLRSIRMTIVVFICGILSAALSLAIVYWSGFSMDAILMSMPALIYVLAVSGAVHITNYYRQAVIHHGFDDAVERGLIHAWKPAILCSITTGIGLASLHTSDIIPIRKFGDFSAIGVFSMLIILFLFLPASLKVWPWTPPEMRERRKKGQAPAIKADAHLQAGRRWEAFGMLINRHHIAVSLSCFAVIGLLCLGLPRITTSIDLLKLFSSDAQLLQDYRWFEEHLGRIVPMELVIVFPEEVRQEDAPPQAQKPGQLVARYTFLERLEFVHTLQQSLVRRLGPKGDDLIGATMSATTFSPSLDNEGSGTAATSVRYATNAEMTKPETRRAFERSGFLRTDKEDGDELWRISVRVAAFSDVDQGEIVKHVRAAVEPVLTARVASVTALKALARRRHGQPQGAKVVFWRHPDDKLAPESPGPFFATKNVRAYAIEKSPAEADETLAAGLKKQEVDGVVLGPGFNSAEINRIRRAKIPILATYDAAAPKAKEKDADDLNVVYTGVIPVVYKAQHELLNSLIKSSAWSFTTITPLMMFICGGVAAGLVMILPNALPVLVVFGGMGWLGIPVDIGSMMAASIALGVAVDDTIHFMAWFSDDYKVLGSRTGAVLSAYRRSATATLQAALINGLGLSVFATSSFTPTKRFGWLMLVIILAGMVAELIMCPSILFGPMGKAFEKKKKIPLESGLPEPVELERLDNGSSGPHDGPHAVREPQTVRKA